MTTENIEALKELRDHLINNPRTDFDQRHSCNCVMHDVMIIHDMDSAEWSEIVGIQHLFGYIFGHPHSIKNKAERLGFPIPTSFGQLDAAQRIQNIIDRYEPKPKFGDFTYEVIAPEDHTDVDGWIKFVESIPHKLISKHNFKNTACVLEHAALSRGLEKQEWATLVPRYDNGLDIDVKGTEIYVANDSPSFHYPQETCKERVLAWLHGYKAMLNPTQAVTDVEVQPETQETGNKADVFHVEQLRKDAIATNG